MADHHLGCAVPIEGVVAYEDKVSPSGVGYDIACGNKAVLLDARGMLRCERTSRTVIMDDLVAEHLVRCGSEERRAG